MRVLTVIEFGKIRENTKSLADLKLWRRKNVWKVTDGDSMVILRSYLGQTFIINHEYFHKTYYIELNLILKTFYEMVSSTISVDSGLRGPDLRIDHVTHESMESKTHFTTPYP